MQLFFIVLLAATATVVNAQPADFSNSRCIERLEISTYPRLADLARVSAIVKSIGRVGSGGLIENIESEVEGSVGSMKAQFREAVQQRLLKSRFDPSCHGRAVTFIFRFLLGEQIGGERVRFSYPNEFTIMAPAKEIQ